MIEQIYLTRRNLETLLKKLDNPDSAKTIVKHFNPGKYEQSMPSIAVTAVEDEDFYVDREPGQMLEDSKPEPVMKNGEVESFLISIGGENFKCQQPDCFANCFHKHDKTKPHIYTCNACGTRYSSE